MRLGIQGGQYQVSCRYLGIPQGNFYYEGINNPVGEALAKALKGEKKTMADFAANPLGTGGILH